MASENGLSFRAGKEYYKVCNIANRDILRQNNEPLKYKLSSQTLT